MRLLLTTALSFFLASSVWADSHTDDPVSKLVDGFSGQWDKFLVSRFDENTGRWTNFDPDEVWESKKTNDRRFVLDPGTGAPEVIVVVSESSYLMTYSNADGTKRDIEYRIDRMHVFADDDWNLLISTEVGEEVMHIEMIRSGEIYTFKMSRNVADQEKRYKWIALSRLITE